MCKHFNAVVVPVNTPPNQSVIDNDHRSDQVYMLDYFKRIVSVGTFYLKETEIMNKHKTLSQYIVLLNDLTAAA